MHYLTVVKRRCCTSSEEKKNPNTNHKVSSSQEDRQSGERGHVQNTLPPSFLFAYHMVFLEGSESFARYICLMH